LQGRNKKPSRHTPDLAIYLKILHSLIEGSNPFEDLADKIVVIDEKLEEIVSKSALFDFE
jgi:hypothetical protein